MTKILPKNPSKEKGQTVLIILLIMAVLLTIVLSVASRTVTDVKISQQTQESARALWVAQAGLEQAMKANVSISEQELGDTGISYQVEKRVLGGGPELVFPQRINADESVTLWLVEHDQETGAINSDTHYPKTGSLTFYWSESRESLSGDDIPALEATVIYLDTSSPTRQFRSRKFVFEPYLGRTPATNFVDVSSRGGGTVAGKTFSYSSTTVDLGTLPSIHIPYLARIRVLFSPAPQAVGVRGGSALPSQGNCFEAIATVVESGITRKPTQCNLWKVTPQIFDYLLFSSETIQ